MPSEGDVTASGEVFLGVFLEVFLGVLMSLCPLVRYASSLQWKDALKLKLTNNNTNTLTNPHSRFSKRRLFFFR